MNDGVWFAWGWLVIMFTVGANLGLVIAVLVLIRQDHSHAQATRYAVRRVDASGNLTLEDMGW